MVDVDAVQFRSHGDLGGDRAWRQRHEAIIGPVGDGCTPMFCAKGDVADASDGDWVPDLPSGSR